MHLVKPIIRFVGNWNPGQLHNNVELSANRDTKILKIEQPHAEIANHTKVRKI